MSRRTRALIGLLVLAALAPFGIVILDEREQAFRTLLNDPEPKVLGLSLNRPVLSEPGWYFRIPLLHQLDRYERRLLIYDAEPRDLYTSEKLLIQVDYYAMWRIDDPRLFFESIRTRDAALRRLDTVTHSAVRNVLARYRLNDLLSVKRAEITTEVARDCDATLRPLGIRVSDLRLRRTDYPPANLARIYDRMRTERERFAMKFRAEGEETARTIRAEADFGSQVVRAEAGREATETRGEGDAQAAKIYAQAYGKNPEFYAFVRSLEAYREALDDQTTLILSPKSPFLKYLFQDGPRPTP